MSQCKTTNKAELKLTLTCQTFLCALCSAGNEQNRSEPHRLIIGSTGMTGLRTETLTHYRQSGGTKHCLGVDQELIRINFYFHSQSGIETAWTEQSEQC